MLQWWHCVCECCSQIICPDVTMLLGCIHSESLFALWPKDATALFFAASNGHANVVRILLEHGADMSIATKVSSYQSLSCVSTWILLGFLRCE